MSTEDHPLHCQDSVEAVAVSSAAAGEPAASVPQLDHTLHKALNMNYIISYSHGPPTFSWWPAVGFLNPNSYPPVPQHPQNPQHQQQPYNGRPFPWYPPYPPFNFYFTPPVFKPPPFYNVRQPTPSLVRYRFSYPPRQPCANPPKGITIAKENLVSKSARLPRTVYFTIKNKLGANTNSPPDIYDETAFPSLNKNKEHLGVSSSRHGNPRTFEEMNKRKDVLSSTSNASKSCEERDKKQDINENFYFGNEKHARTPLVMVIERKCLPKENAETNSRAINTEKNKDLPRETAPNTAGYQRGSQVTFSNPSRAPIDLLDPISLNLSVNDPGLYGYIFGYVPEDKWLEQLGYPSLSVKNPKETIIWKQYNHTTDDKWGNKRDKVKSFDKLCDRCGNPFVMKPGKNGQYEKCVYHWGKIKNTQNFEVYLTCCNRPPTSNGCTTAKSHVWNGLYFGMNRLKGFVSPAFCVDGTSHRIFGLDCEMCFTTEGLELVKVAMVDLAGNQVYFSLVFPENEVLDYNTRFSGVSERDFLSFKAKSFRNVQEDVLKLIKTDTIIIGHGLENDLRVLKIVHQLVVDTSLVYPHSHGLPSKRTLKDIAKEVLKREIQNGGHNPTEDAKVCVELILKKLQDDFDVNITPEVK